VRTYAKTIYRLIRPIIDLRKVINSIPAYIDFCRDLKIYRQMDKNNSVKFGNLFPFLFGKTEYTNFDAHYVYQKVWAFSLILSSEAKHHTDVGSSTDYVGMLSVVTKVTSVDIRPIKTSLENLSAVKANILSLPYRNNSVGSLSCLHVAEHIGLGRYGDPIDPQGTEKAAREMVRVLAPEGNLYFSIPIGRPRVCFNAHRIHSPEQILEMFSDIDLEEFSAISDEGEFVRFAPINAFVDSVYSCGLFHFRKKRGAL